VHGLGVGLPLSRELARRRGGDVWLIAAGGTAPHTGVFGARLHGVLGDVPAEDSPESGPAPDVFADRRDPTSLTTPLRVLVVDDDFRVAGLHREIVAERPGYHALAPVRTLADATAAVRTEHPDLLLVDAYLPDGDGIAFVRENPIDAFVLSAATDAATVRRALRAGALGYLVKPFERRASWTSSIATRFRNVLDEERSVSQDEIDRALGILHAGGDTSSVSRSATEQVILGALGDDESSAAEIADRAGVSRPLRSATSRRWRPAGSWTCVCATAPRGAPSTGTCVDAHSGACVRPSVHACTALCSTEPCT
jgi:two-component system CitB family response regulator